MGSPNFGPAQGLYDMARGLYDKGQKVGQFLHMLPTPTLTPQQPVDTSWHDQMVRHANEVALQQSQKPDVTQMQKPLPKGK